MRRGSLLHACFEQGGWLDEKVPTREELVKHLNQISTESIDVGGVIDEFFEMNLGFLSSYDQIIF